MYVYMCIFIHGSHSVECGGTAVVVLVCCSLSSSGGQSETLRFFLHHCLENNEGETFETGLHNWQVHEMIIKGVNMNLKVI